MIEAYPLYWPEGRPRAGTYRERARFDTSFARGRDEIVRQVRLMIGRCQADKELIISTNIPLRRDGLPLAGQKQPNDPGVAVYFNYKKRQVCFACDRWEKVEDNMQAIAKTIDALRGIERWGTGDMVEAAFRGFAALPAPSNWKSVLFPNGAPPDMSLGSAKRNYLQLASQHHPDKGGDPSKMSEVNAAWEQAQKELS